MYIIKHVKNVKWLNSIKQLSEYLHNHNIIVYAKYKYI